jgi:predicted nucleotidyltransferase
VIENSTTIREDVLRDPRHPVHQIADRLMPYLRVLVENFHPQQVILFGSYAYGNPDLSSDIDLIVIKDLKMSSIQEATAIRRAWRPLRWTLGSLPFDLLVLDEQKHSDRLRHAAGFYDQAVTRGLRIV